MNVDELLQGRVTRSPSSASTASRSSAAASRVIPVAAAVRGGGGGGGDDSNNGGGGFGLQARPVGAYVIRDGEVEWEAAVDATRIALSALGAFVLVAPAQGHAMTEVLTERDGSVLNITLNRPDVFNAFNAALHAALADALAEAADASVRAVVITAKASRGSTCASSRSSGRSATGRGLVPPEHPGDPRASVKPVLAAVNGPPRRRAVARMCVRHPHRLRRGDLRAGLRRIGLVPDSGGSWFIHRILGPRAFEWMSSNRRLSAAEASWGLVSEVVPAADFSSRVAAVAAEAERPTRGVALTKRLFEQAWTNGLEEQLELEAELQQEATGTADFAEGVTVPREAAAALHRPVSAEAPPSRPFRSRPPTRPFVRRAAATRDRAWPAGSAAAARASRASR